MRKIILIAATTMCLGAITISSPNHAQARFGAEAMATAAAGISSAQQAQYYRGNRRYRGSYGAYGPYGGAYGAYGSAYGAYGSANGAYAYQPSPTYNYWYNAPATVYSGSREALDSCYYC